MAHTTDFITWEVLRTPAGQVAAIMLIAQGLKHLFDAFTSPHSKYMVYGLALVFQVAVLFIPEYAIIIQNGILALVRALRRAFIARECTCSMQNHQQKAWLDS